MIPWARGLGLNGVGIFLASLTIFMQSASWISSDEIAIGLGRSGLIAQSSMDSGDSSREKKGLYIVQATPSGKITIGDERKEIFVVFSKPMVPLQKLDQTTKGVFRLSPSVPGKFRWYGSRVCAFVPEQKWRAGQSYTVTVPGETQDLSGNRLGRDYRFSFELKLSPLKVRHIYPRTRNRIDYKQSFRLRFNFPVALKDLRRHVHLTNNGRSIPVKINYYSRRKKSRRDRVLIKPQKSFARDSTVRLRLDAALSADNYPTSLSRGRSYRYKTYGPLKVSLSSPPKYYQYKWRYYLRFSNPVNYKDVAESARVSPSVRLVRERKGSGKRFYLYYWDMKPGQNYTIDLSELKDKYGNAIAGKTRFGVNMPSYRPKLHVNRGHGVLEAKMSHRVRTRVAGIPEIRVASAEYGVGELQRKLADYRYRFDNKLSLDSHVWRTGLNRNQKRRLPFDLKNIKQKDYGWFFVQYDYDSDYKYHRPRRQKIQVTDLGLTIKESNDWIYAWVSSLTDGKDISGVDVAMYDANEKLADCTTDATGYCRFRRPKPEHWNKVLFVAQKGEDRAYVSSRNHRVSMHSLVRNYRSFKYDNQLLGSFMFDRKLYRPGETMRFKGVLARRDGELRPLKQKTVQVKIVNAKGKTLYSKRQRTSTQGSLWGEIDLPKDAPLGHYRIRAAKKFADARYNQSITDSFQVEEFKPVSFAVRVKAPEKMISGQKVAIKAGADYLFGAPMAGAELRYYTTQKRQRVSFANYEGFTFGDRYRYDSSGNEYKTYSGKTVTLGRDGRYTINLTVPHLQKKQKINKPQKTFTMKAPFRYQIVARVKSVDDKKVTKKIYRTVYPGKFVIGMRPQNRYQHHKKTFKIRAVALQNNGDKVQRGKNLRMRVVRHKWSSIKTKGPSGSVYWKNRMTKKLVQDKRVQVGGQIKTIPLQVDKSGEYWITLHDPQSGVYSRIYVYAFGGKHFWAMPDDDRITVRSDKKRYVPGETAKILVQSPFPEAKAIVTVERDKILWQKRVQLSSSKTPIRVPIKKSYFPNAYVSVMVISPRRSARDVAPDRRDQFAAKDQGRPRFKMGVRKIMVQSSDVHVPLKFSTGKKTYGPGEKVSVTFRTAPGAELALAVADRAVLDLINYKYQNPGERFYKNWPLSMRVLENRSHLLKQYARSNKGNSPGGGGDQGRSKEGGFAAKNEDGLRRDFRYTAHWDPNIKADSSGTKTVTFRLPDNLTTFRLSVLSAKDGKYNVAHKEIKVRKPLVVKKLVPSFIRPGDELQIGATLINQTSRFGNFTVELDLPRLEKSGQSYRKTVFLPRDRAVEVIFPVKLSQNAYDKYISSASGSKDGNDGESLVAKGKISVRPKNSARYRKLGYNKSRASDALTFRLPIQKHQVEEAFTIAGFTEKRIREAVTLPSENKAGSARLSVSLANTSLLGLKNGFDFYRGNPYFCLEQQASAYLLAITSGKLLKHFGQNPPPGKSYDFARIRQNFLENLSDFQNKNGGFRLWKNSRRYRSHAYLTAYVLNVLQIAEEQGESLPAELNSVRSEAYRYLRKFVRRPKNRPRSYVLETYALINYVLALERKQRGGAGRELSQFLLEKRESLSLRGRAYLLLALNQSEDRSSYQKEAKHLLRGIANRMEVTTRRVTFKEEGRDAFRQAFYTKGSTVALIARALMAWRSDHPFLPKLIRFVMDKRSHVWRDSHSTGQLAKALYDYYHRYDKTESAITGRVEIGGRKFLQESFAPNRLLPADKQIGQDAFARFGTDKTLPLTFAKKGEGGRLYYTATLAYSPYLAEIKPRDEGIEIRREYYPLAKLTDSSGANESAAKLEKMEDLRFERGELYLVKLIVVNAKPMSNFLLEEPLAAGFGAVNTRFKTEDPRLQRILHSRRQSSSDRGYLYYQESFYQYRDSRVVITENYLPAGYHEYYYIMRPVVKGTAYNPPVQAKAMYEPEIFGRSGSSRVTIY